jgi:hypothetical protein
VAPQDQPQRGQARVHVPAPAERGQAEADQRVQALVGGVAQLVRRDLRVDEDGLAESGRDGQEVVVGRVVQRAAARPAVDHRADVTQPDGAPFEFGGRGLRIAGRQGRERAEPIRVRADGAGGLVVGVPGQRNGLPGRQGLRGGGDHRQDRDVDPGGVHRLQAARPDVLQPRLVVAHPVEGDAVVARLVRQPVQRVTDGGTVPVLLDRDDPHVDIFQQRRDGIVANLPVRSHLATFTASSVSVIDWMPGEVSDRITRSMPVASMILMRQVTPVPWPDMAPATYELRTAGVTLRCS